MRHASLSALSPEDLSAHDSDLASLFEGTPFHPLKIGHRLPGEVIAAHELSGLEQLLKSGGLATLLEDAGQVAGLASVARRDWESKYYPFALGHIPTIALRRATGNAFKAYVRLLNWAMYAARNQLGVAHLFCRAPAEDIALTHALEEAGFRHMATMLEFSWRREPPDKPPVEWPLRPATEDDWPAVQALARATLTGIPTRYTADPHLPLDGTQDLYGAWARESMDGRFADTVLIVEDPDRQSSREVAGFICGRFDPNLSELLGRKVGDLTIGGVLPAHRGGGAFVSLVQGLMNWLWDHGAESMLTRTQVNNIGSQRALLRCHGRIASAHHCFHAWLSE